MLIMEGMIFRGVNPLKFAFTTSFPLRQALVDTSCVLIKFSELVCTIIRGTQMGEAWPSLSDLTVGLELCFISGQAIHLDMQCRFPKLCQYAG